MIAVVIFWARRLWPFVTVGALLVAAFAIMQTCRGPASRVEIRAAHKATVAAEQVAKQTTASFHEAVVAYDTTRKHVHLTDTNWVKVTLERADTAIARGERALVARDTVESKLKTELDLARRGPSRFSVVGDGLYDPISRTYAASARMTFRVVGDWSVVARADRRFEPGGSRLYVGLSHPLF